MDRMQVHGGTRGIKYVAKGCHVYVSHTGGTCSGDLVTVNKDVNGRLLRTKKNGLGGGSV